MPLEATFRQLQRVNHQIVMENQVALIAPQTKTEVVFRHPREEDLIQHTDADRGAQLVVRVPFGQLPDVIHAVVVGQSARQVGGQRGLHLDVEAPPVRVSGQDVEHNQLVLRTVLVLDRVEDFDRRDRPRKLQDSVEKMNGDAGVVRAANTSFLVGRGLFWTLGAPLTPDIAIFYFVNSCIVLGIVVVLAGWAARTATGGTPLWKAFE
jgi:hypothetical protein